MSIFQRNLFLVHCAFIGEAYYTYYYSYKVYAPLG